ncbi:ornithine carbamoyltransferase [Xylariomycetidae sp. FL2044]|nr:ornithine carbamoyltransferase [Xylariomycetidae sp. FL2044]
MRSSAARLAAQMSSGPRGFHGRPRHLMSIADLQPSELTRLVQYASLIKQKKSALSHELRSSLLGSTVPMMFSKRSTRTRVSTEAAVAMMGGHPMFLGKDDIQLGVNESLHDTSKIISSMTSCMVARVGPHSDVVELARHSSVPVINALSDDFHPLQIIADFLTIHEASSSGGENSPADPNAPPRLLLLPPGLKVAWVGDANNVLFDLAIGCLKLGVDIAVAAPRGYGIPGPMAKFIRDQAPPAAAAGGSDNGGGGGGGAGTLTEYEVPEEAVKDADFIVTDTWVSMGQEAETQKRLRDFEGFQVTNELAARGGAKKDWKFMHCLPRHPEEVADEVFYSPRSLVFQEGENRLWAAAAVLKAFVVDKGDILKPMGARSNFP